MAAAIGSRSLSVRELVCGENAAVSRLEPQPVASTSTKRIVPTRDVGRQIGPAIASHISVFIMRTPGLVLHRQRGAWHLDDGSRMVHGAPDVCQVHLKQPNAPSQAAGGASGFASEQRYEFSPAGTNTLRTGQLQRLR